MSAPISPIRAQAGRQQPATERRRRNKVTVTLTDEREPAARARLDFVDNRLDAASGTIRGARRSSRTRTFPDPGPVRPGHPSGLGSLRGVLVPDEALGSDQDRRIVYVVGRQPDDARPVRLGPRIDG